MKKQIKILSAALLAGTVVVGCSNTSDGTAKPSGETSSSSTQTSSAALSGAPKVSNPVNVDKIRASPCSVLVSSEANQLGLPGTGVANPSDPIGSSCNWANTATVGPMMTVGLTADSAGLSLVYKNHTVQPTYYKVFQPLSDINGFPALHLEVDVQTGTNCGIAIGLSDHDAYEIQVEGITSMDPCTYAKAAAAAITSNIRKNQ